MLLDVIFMFCIDLWGFSINPVYWFITLQNRKLLFCVFLSFGDLSKLKGARIFLALLFFLEKEHEKKKHTRGPTSTCGAGLRPCHPSSFAP
jgi:hypothetical protein